ncbi:MAG: NIPSNAP family protein [Flavobacteriaceae bacterium]|nr:NIPSNAP family protein [Flavobacteriaceae bacterium]
MKRRKFIQSTVIASAVASVLPFSNVTSQELPFIGSVSEKELYELRTYELRFGGNKKLLIDYLDRVFQPALKRIGVNHFMIFEELDNSNPTKLRVLISYPNTSVYLSAQNLYSDLEYVKEAKKYNSLTPDQAIYNRYNSSLLLAFDGMPKLIDSVKGASLFELRTYEGFSEDAVKRKIKMFNKEEIQLFLKTNLHPVFFGEMIAGPYRPCLTYMLNFKDMEEHDSSWKDFINHPEWKVMSTKEEYANTVSNIRKVFLKPIRSER